MEGRQTWPIWLRNGPERVGGLGGAQVKMEAGKKETICGHSKQGNLEVKSIFCQWSGTLKALTNAQTPKSKPGSEAASLPAPSWRPQAGLYSQLPSNPEAKVTNPKERPLKPKGIFILSSLTSGGRGGGIGGGQGLNGKP